MLGLLLAMGWLVVGSPRVDLGGEADASTSLFPKVGAIAVSSLEDGVPMVATVRTMQRDVGRIALAHLKVPSADTMPVLPDIPAHIAGLRVDQRPVAALAAPPPRSPRAGRLNGAPDDATQGRSAGKFLKPPTARDAAARVTGNRLVLRAGPAKRFPALRTLPRGADVKITGARQGGYVPVTLAKDGRSGWVFHRYVERLN